MLDLETYGGHSALWHAYRTNARQRQLVIEAGYFNRLDPFLVTSPNHDVEAVLNPDKDFRIALKHPEDLRVCLLNKTNVSSK